jgi:hypothetical protein
MDPIISIASATHATYTIRIPGVVGRKVDKLTEEEETYDLLHFYPIYASNPFQTRTHILSNPHSKVLYKDKPITVLKDQVCRLPTGFDEYTILNHIHGPGNVPGVVEATYHEQIDLPFPNRLGVPVYKVKNRIGMRQCGRPFMSIPNMKEMLMTVYDTLEGNVLTADGFECTHFPQY